MDFHFEFDIKPLPIPVSHRHSLLLIGSCFTENIGDKLRRHKFRTLDNPNGILFNPVSVSETIINIINNKQYTEADLFQLNEAWHSWQHHSRFSGLSAAEALEKINTSTQQAHAFLKTTDYLLITLGSAWVYTLTDKAVNATAGTVAANNHRAPSDWFERRLMSSEQVAMVLGTMLDQLGAFNPNINVIFTISPVRHLREGVVDNNRSKAALIQAVHQLIDYLPKLYYFPVYELVIDDLRDYRFYAEDMVHPNYQATQYVWEKFINACMSDDTRALMEEIASINLAYQHKPFHPTSQQHKKFLASYGQKAAALQQQHPYIDLQKEIDYFNS